MLRVGERKGFSTSLSLISRNGPEREQPAQLLEGAPAVPLIARDAFVAETATKIDQLQASVRLLKREVDALVPVVSELQSTNAQDHRWHAFQQGERRTREAKLDDLLRRCCDLKARIDKMEARGNGNFHAYNSFEAVSRKLAELEGFREEAQRVRRNVTLRAWLFCGALVASTAILVASNVLAG